MDSSGDGRVGFAEFNAWWMQNHDKNKYQLRDSKAAFDKFDVSGDGELDADELRMLLDDLGMKDVTPEDIEDLMGELDTDGDGVVVFAEFEPWWRENGGKTYAGRSRERDRTGGGSPRRKGLKGAA